MLREVGRELGGERKLYFDEVILKSFTRTGGSKSQENTKHGEIDGQQDTVWQPEHQQSQLARKRPKEGILRAGDIVSSLGQRTIRHKGRLGG